MTPRNRNPLRTGLILVVLVVMVGLARAERLPIRAFTTEDGLPSNLVGRIYRDSQGFLWFGTRHGLTNEWVLRLYEDSHGRVWIGTLDWLSVLAENPTPDRPVVTRLYTEDLSEVFPRHDDTCLVEPGQRIRVRTRGRARRRGAGDDERQDQHDERQDQQR